MRGDISPLEIFVFNRFFSVRALLGVGSFSFWRPVINRNYHPIGQFYKLYSWSLRTGYDAMVTGLSFYFPASFFFCVFLVAFLLAHIPRVEA